MMETSNFRKSYASMALLIETHQYYELPLYLDSFPHHKGRRLDDENDQVCFNHS